MANYYDGLRRNIHPIELASIFHQKFEEIHPFQEGNGRTGREIINYMLKTNYKQVYFEKSLRLVNRYIIYVAVVTMGLIPFIDASARTIDAKIDDTISELVRENNDNVRDSIK